MKRCCSNVRIRMGVLGSLPSMEARIRHAAALAIASIWLSNSLGLSCGPEAMPKA
jgi:hypothetical protein